MSMEKKVGTVAREEKIRAKRKQIKAIEKEGVLSLEGESLCKHGNLLHESKRERERNIFGGGG